LVILGIETSGVDTGLALLRDGTTVFRHVEPPGPTHSEVALPLLDRLLRESGIAAPDIDSIGVTIGPGMFTSLRVGLAAAKGLALARGTPIKGIGTLPALSASIGTHGPSLAVVDARKGEVYAAAYRDGRELLAPCVITPAALPPTLQSVISNPTCPDLQVAGSGTLLCLDLLRAAGMTATDTGIRCPDPAVVARLAAIEIKAGRADDIESLEPLYLRRTDAELNRERQA
jgi:tRNA threonylcarbamoyladenosine biosynthesis protein TsaB